jgi:hypothetical protein
MNSRFLAAGVIGLLSAQAAHATTTTIFDTINGIQPQFYDGPADATFHAGDSFTSASPDFNTVALSLSADVPTDGGSVSVYLYADDGTGNGQGLPGAPTGTGVLLGSIDDSVLASTAAVANNGGPAGPSGAGAGIPVPTLTFSTSLIPTTADDEYWIEVDFAGSSAELFDNGDDSGLNSSGQNAITDYVDGTITGPVSVEPGNTDYGLYAISVSDVTADVTPPIPEPASIALLGAGLAGLGFSRRREAN